MGIDTKKELEKNLNEKLGKKLGLTILESNLDKLSPQLQQALTNSIKIIKGNSSDEDGLSADGNTVSSIQSCQI